MVCIYGCVKRKVCSHKNSNPFKKMQLVTRGASKFVIGEEGLFALVQSEARDLLTCYPPGIKSPDDIEWFKPIGGANEVETISGLLLSGIVPDTATWQEWAPLANDPYLAYREAKLFMDGDPDSIKQVCELTRSYIIDFKNDFPGLAKANALLGSVGDNQIGLYATRTILPGDEITTGYGVAYWLNSYFEQLRINGHWSLANDLRIYIMEFLHYLYRTETNPKIRKDCLEVMIQSIGMPHLDPIPDKNEYDLSCMFLPPNRGCMKLQDPLLTSRVLKEMRNCKSPEEKHQIVSKYKWC
jgi:hypothetical protein